jgi:hypothetical protein
MKRFVLSLGGGLVVAGLAVAAYAHDGKHKEAEGKEAAVVGELIDTACYVAADGDAKGKDHAECASKCLGSGVPAGILPEGSKSPDQMMFLLTNPAVLAPYAAQTIKVEGTTHPKMHAIDVKKLFVKQGTGWKEVQLKDEHHKMAGGEEKKTDGHKDHEHK